jgi:nicotinamidase/pyrazinamidase
MDSVASRQIEAIPGHALLVVDMQNDFMPGGALGVDGGEEIVPLVNQLIGQFHDAGLPIVFSRDWHPEAHCSFEAQGGPWPPHCVQGSIGAEFAPAVHVPEDAIVVSKASRAEEEAYSAFQGTELAELLHRKGVSRVLIVGLATDYCVLASARDALKKGFEIIVLEEGVRAVNVRPGDGRRALQELRKSGAEILRAA